jgi:hypothetical protein
MVEVFDPASISLSKQDLKVQFVPHRKHPVSITTTKWLMLVRGKSLPVVIIL